MLRIRRSLAALLVAVAAALAAAAPAEAAPVWRAIESPIAGAGGGAKPQVAFDAAGNALLTWRADEPGFGFRQVRYAWRPRNGALGYAGAISDYGATWHSTAVGWTGESIVAWKMDDESVHVAVSPGVGQPFGPPTTLGRPDAQSFFGEPKVVVDDVGNAVVVWMRYGRGSTLPNAAMAATRAEGEAAWSAPFELGPAGFGGIIDVAANSGGLFAVAWRGTDNQTNVAIREPGAASFGPPQAVDLVGPGPMVTVAPDGTITITGNPGAAAGPMAGPGDARSVVRPAGATAFGPSGPPPDLGLAIPPGARDITRSATTDGRSLITWALGPERGGVAKPEPIQFAERPPGGAWTTPAAPPGDPAGLWVTSAIGRSGSIGIAWSQQIGVYTLPVQLLVREDPDAALPTRPSRTALPGTPGVPPAAEPSLSARAARGGTVRVELTCLSDCRVRGVVRGLGRLRAQPVPAGEPTTVVLRPGERLARRIRARRRDDRRVVIRVEVLAGGEVASERRVVLG